MKPDEYEVVHGNGNIFRDCDDPYADLKQAKAVLADQIISLLGERHLTVRKVEKMTHFAAADFFLVFATRI